MTHQENKIDVHKKIDLSYIQFDELEIITHLEMLIFK